jgi:hypothetical protein
LPADSPVRQRESFRRLVRFRALKNINIGPLLAVPMDYERIARESALLGRTDGRHDLEIV